MSRNKQHDQTSCPINCIYFQKEFESVKNQLKQTQSILIHQYKNSFKLYDLPIPRQGKIVGVIGQKRVGKSTSLKILSGKIKPNFGKELLLSSNQIMKINVLELKQYLLKLSNNKIKTIIKSQYLEQFSLKLQGSLGQIIKLNNFNGKQNMFKDILDISHLYQRELDQISGGQLQRFSIMLVCISSANALLFDQLSTYLDIKQRFKAVQVIKNLINQDNFCFITDNDLALIDYLCHTVHIINGNPSISGKVTMSFNIRKGIQIFLQRFVSISNTKQLSNTVKHFKYGNAHAKKSKFQLEIMQGTFCTSQIIVLLGENGSGKTTFLQMINKKQIQQFSQFTVSYKPQNLSPTFQGSVRQLLTLKLKNSWMDVQFKTQVSDLLKLDKLLEFKVKMLSGGQLQIVALILCLCKQADIYLIDQPSAYLDVEQRIMVAKVIKKFIFKYKKIAFIVEHDFIMASYLSDKVIIYEGIPGQKCKANSPQRFFIGANKFLSRIGITYQQNKNYFYSKINKLNIDTNKIAKHSGNYFSLEE